MSSQFVLGLFLEFILSGKQGHQCDCLFTLWEFVAFLVALLPVNVLLLYTSVHPVSHLTFLPNSQNVLVYTAQFCKTHLSNYLCSRSAATLHKISNN